MASTGVALTCLVLGVAGCGGDDEEEPTVSNGDKTAQVSEGEIETGAEPEADTEGAKLELEPVAQMPRPTYVAQPPGAPNLLYVTEQTGRISVIRNGRLQRKLFLNLQDLVNDDGSEQGLLSIAFPPDYKRSGLFYVAYTDADDSVRVEEFKRTSALHADRDSRRTLLVVPHRKPKHNGGLVVFGPDGHLYVGLGDGGTVNKPRLRAQKPSTLLGKIIRIDPATPSGALPYSIPNDNPFVGEPGRDEIFALGLRNPWRFSFDPETNALSIGDVGRLDQEEIDHVSAEDAPGANFGWPIYEGDIAMSTIFLVNPSYRKSNLFGGEAVEPVLVYGHDEGCSVIGGYVVRDPDLPELAGRYVYSDACTGEVRSFVPDPDGAKDDRSEDVFLPPTEGLFGLVSFGLDQAGHVYAVSHGGGVFRLVSKKG